MIVLLISSVAILYSFQHQFHQQSREDHHPLLRLGTTTSLFETGIWDILEPLFEDYYSVELDIVVGGTGQTLEYGLSGNVDVIIVHDQPRERKFVSDGYGIKRNTFAYNNYVIIGPAHDPSDVASMTVKGAMAKIMDMGMQKPDAVRFVSRGDNSGTHSSEQAFWKDQGHDYETVRNSGPWYIESGSGMGTTLVIADQKSAYTLVPDSTYLAYGATLELVILAGEETPIVNPYSAIIIDPNRYPHINETSATDFIEFLYSTEVQKIIDAYGVDLYGAPIFRSFMAHQNLK